MLHNVMWSVIGCSGLLYNGNRRVIHQPGWHIAYSIYNLFNSSLAVIDLPTIQDGCRNMWLEISQVTVEKYSRLIYVNANEPRHRVMRTRRVRRAGG